MDDDIELVSDGESLAVFGERNAVERFLHSVGLLATSKDLGMDKLSAVFGQGSEIAQAASEISARTGRYIKLTKESSEHMHEFGLMPTKTKGVSHAMLGDPGSISKWLQVEDGVGQLLANPALLSGAAGIMAQLARQHEARELKELLVQIDAKLGEVRRRQRDEVLAKLDRVVEALEDAMFIRKYAGDQQTAWEKVVAESATIAEIRADALRAIEALADKISNNPGVGRLAKSMKEIEQELAIWLAVLARCFQLDDEYQILELEHVLVTAPAAIDRHRLALNESKQKRRGKVSNKTQDLLRKMDEASGFASANVLLHAWAAKSIIDSINQVGGSVEEFHRPLAIDFSRDALTRVPWNEAIRDRQQLKNAGFEAGRRTLQGVAVAAGAALTVAAAIKAKEESSDAKP